MLKEAEKNVLAQKLMVFNVIANSSGNKDFIGQVMDTWNRYLSVTYGVEVAHTHSLTEKTMQEEYELIKNLRPEFKVQKDGSISIKGFEKFLGKK